MTEEPDKSVQNPGSLLGWVRAGLGLLITLVAIAYGADMFSRLGIALYTEQFLAAVLGLSLALVFLMERERKVRWFDALAAFIGLGCGIYLLFRYPYLVERQLDLPVEGLVVSALLFVLVLEGLRRAVGWTLVIVVLVIFVYGLVGYQFTGPLQTREVSLDRMLIYVGLDPNGLLGLTLAVAATIVIGFVLFGQLLLRSGGADFFNDLAMSLMGRSRGGSGKIATVASALFGSISGVVVSNIVATGVVTIRMMIRGGFRPQTAGAIEAVASTGGQIMPPVMGAVAFLMAEFLQVSYSEVVIAALIPAFLYYVSLFIQVDLEAAKEDIARIDDELIPSKREVLKAGWIFVLPFGAIISALFFFNMRPETAALIGAVGAIVAGLVFGYRGERMSFGSLVQSFSRTGETVVDIIMIAAAAGFIIGVLNLSGLGFGLTYALVQLGDGNLLILLSVSALVCIILGMGMPTVGVYMLLAVLVAPSLVEVGVEPIAAHLFIFYMGMMSMITPPIAIGSFFAASIAKADPMKTALTSMRLGWTAYIVPFIFVVSPGLLMMGDVTTIVWSVMTATLGVWCVSVGFVGYFSTRLVLWQRVVAIVAGALFLLPVSSLPGLEQWGRLIAMLCLVTLLVTVFVRRRPKIANSPLTADMAGQTSD